ncbi:uncharacterized protein [Aegilops tauschii subsp. strangulata]|uniref:uncharacterized protein n=1 Tax=Triticum aestivum TaxID=4565 RepID=UPI00098A963D|nr:uncharacterized protein LOC123125273 [Triticum aestivum]XP_045084116.1 uncharacterized protein LOC109740702 [Aegilops tauschii subsp. strangulata]
MAPLLLATAGSMEAEPKATEMSRSDEHHARSISQTLFCALLPACVTSRALFEPAGSDYVGLAIYAGLLFVTAVTYAGMFASSRASGGKASLRVVACAAIAVLTIAAGSQLSGAAHVAAAAFMGVVTSLIEAIAM